MAENPVRTRVLLGGVLASMPIAAAGLFSENWAMALGGFLVMAVAAYLMGVTHEADV